MRMDILRFLMVSWCAALLSACSTAQPSPTAAPDPFVAVLQKYGWTPQGEPTIQPFTVSDTTKPPFLVALEASQAIGMDFSTWQGKSVNQRSYFLGRDPKANLEVFGNLLADGEHVIGGWLFVKGQYPGVHPLTTHLSDLVTGQPGMVRVHDLSALQGKAYWSDIRLQQDPWA